MAHQPYGIGQAGGYASDACSDTARPGSSLSFLPSRAEFIDVVRDALDLVEAAPLMSG